MAFEELFYPHSDLSGIFSRGPAELIGLWSGGITGTMFGGPYKVTGGSLLPVGDYVLSLADTVAGTVYATNIATGATTTLFDVKTIQDATGVARFPYIAIYNNKLVVVYGKLISSVQHDHIGFFNTTANMLAPAVEYNTKDVLISLGVTVGSSPTMCSASFYELAGNRTHKYGVTFPAFVTSTGAGALVTFSDSGVSQLLSNYTTTATGFNLATSAINGVSESIWVTSREYGTSRVDLNTNSIVYGAKQVGSSPNFLETWNTISDQYAIGRAVLGTTDKLYVATYAPGGMTYNYLGLAKVSVNGYPEQVYGGITGVSATKFVGVGSSYFNTGKVFAEAVESAESSPTFNATPTTSFTEGLELYTPPTGATVSARATHRYFSKNPDGSTLLYVPLTIGGLPHSHFVRVT